MSASLTTRNGFICLTKFPMTYGNLNPSIDEARPIWIRIAAILSIEATRKGGVGCSVVTYKGDDTEFAYVTETVDEILDKL